MTIQEFHQLNAERTVLERMLSEIPAQDVLDRSGLQVRIEELSEQLAAAGTPRRSPARAILTFRGRPVVEHHGIFADFGTDATHRFADAVAAVAAGRRGPLPAMGPVPHRDDGQLLITSTAVGSFGFELTEHRPSLLDFDDENPAGEAIETVRDFLQATQGNDDELADAAASVDPRAIAAVREFLDHLSTKDAVCALEYGGRVARFKDVGAVRLAAQRLSQDNLQETETSLHGDFLGVLPQGRRFEFKLSSGGEVIRGKIGPAIADADEINRHLHQPTQITVTTTQVGNGKPRYVLLAMPAW